MFDRLRHVILKLLISLSVLFLIIVGVLYFVEEGEKLGEGLLDIVDELLVALLAALVQFGCSLAVPRYGAIQVLRILEYLLLAYSLVLVYQLLLLPLALASVQLEDLLVDIFFDEVFHFFEEVAHEVALLGDVVLYLLDRGVGSQHQSAGVLHVVLEDCCDDLVKTYPAIAKGLAYFSSHLLKRLKGFLYIIRQVLVERFQVLLDKIHHLPSERSPPLSPDDHLLPIADHAPAIPEHALFLELTAVQHKSRNELALFRIDLYLQKISVL